MGITIVIVVAYSLFQVIFYIKNRHFKEILVLLVLLSISVFYLIDYYKEQNALRLTGLLIFIFEPVSKLLFGMVN